MEFNTKSSTGKAIGEALKNHAISTGKNLLTDIVAGNKLNEGIKREVGNIRQNAALGIQQLANTNKHYESDDESEIETNKKIQSKRKNQTKKKKQNNFNFLLDDEIRIKKKKNCQVKKEKFDFVKSGTKECRDEVRKSDIKELKSKKLKILNYNIYERIEGDITYLRNGNVKLNEDIYLNREIMKYNDEIYVKCGMVLRCDETTLYLVYGRLLEECEEDSENEDEIVQWRDGKYYKRFLLDSEKELENKYLKLKKINLELKKINHELKKRKLELKIELKKKTRST